MTWLGTYILDAQGEPAPCYDTLEWAAWFETSQKSRRVAVTDLGERGRVSTVFLALDHSFSPILNPLDYQPVLWETMVFGGPCDQDTRRYTSREAAERGHEAMVSKCMEEAWPL